MTPFSIVKNLDVVEQAAIRGPVVEPVFVVGQLGLEQMEEGLSHGVIPTVALAAHALHKAVFTDPVGERGAGVLNAAIGVDDQAPRRTTLSYSPLQRDQRHAVIQCRAQRPTHHAPGVQVDDDDQIQPAATDAEVGQVADPHLIGALCGEITLQTVRRHRKSMLRVGRHLETAAHNRPQTQHAHAPCDAILAHRPAPVYQGRG